MVTGSPDTDHVCHCKALLVVTIYLEGQQTIFLPKDKALLIFVGWFVCFWPHLPPIDVLGQASTYAAAVVTADP